MLRAFEAVGRTGSMRRAAEDIGVSHTVVSRHVRNLESWLGQKLVQSSPRGATLTAAGETLFRATCEAFKSIAKTAIQLRVDTRARVLRVCCMPGLAARWLAPRLTAMRNALPDVDINLRALDYGAGNSNIDADLIIGFGDVANLPSGAKPLIRPRMFPVVSPEWLAKNDVPPTLQHLLGSDLIHEESYEQWAAWLEAAGVAINRPLSGIRLGDASMGFDAALAGQGIALTTRLMVAKDMDAGHLIELFDTDIRLGGYFLEAREDGKNRSDVERFRSWLVEALNEDR
nr:LysR substrate-binding domain-containing protein [Notoacmeibacter sp. MSK16QG-6]